MAVFSQQQFYFVFEVSDLYEFMLSVHGPNSLKSAFGSRLK